VLRRFYQRHGGTSPELSFHESRGPFRLTIATRREFGNQALARPLGSIVVKGKTEPVDIFELEGLKQHIVLETH
jgi:hypothetical protein